MTEPTVSAADLTIEAMTQSARSLIASWNERDDVQMSQSNLGRDTTVFGYVMHAHRLGEAYLVLIDMGEWEVAYPTLRACYELSVHAQWVLATPGAFHATLAENERARKKLIVTAREAQSISSDEADERITKVQKDIDAYDELKKKGTQTTFKGLTEDFDSPFLYLMYRVLSNLAHAGPAIPTLYIEADTEGGLAGFVNPVHSDMEKRAALHQLCMSLVWAGAAVDGLSDRRARRVELDEAAEYLGIPAFLELGEKAKKREGFTRLEFGSVHPPGENAERSKLLKGLGLAKLVSLVMTQRVSDCGITALGKTSGSTA